MAKNEMIVVGPGGGLKNVIVFLKDAPPTATASAEPVVLDQVNCVFVPHVVAVQTGQTLRIKSSDSLMHNAHLQCVANPDANFGFPAPGQKDVVLNLPESPFRVKCDVHPWMTAWVGVFAHPWFAVSADDGSFTIDHVPPGDYTLAAWQEALPQQEQTIHVTGDKPVEVLFSFQAP
jgi:plastocyanin